MANDTLSVKLDQIFAQEKQAATFFPLYESVRNAGALLLRHHIGSTQTYLPVALMQDLFGNQLPEIWALKDVVYRHTSGILKLCENQPLLEQRILSYSRGNVPINTNTTEFIAEADRFRRLRNSLVHEMEFETHLELYTLWLYKLSRSYIRELLKRLASTNGSPEIEQLLGLPRILDSQI